MGFDHSYQPRLYGLVAIERVVVNELPYLFLGIILAEEVHPSTHHLNKPLEVFYLGTVLIIHGSTVATPEYLSQIAKEILAFAVNKVNLLNGVSVIQSNGPVVHLEKLRDHSLGRHVDYDLVAEIAGRTILVVTGAGIYPMGTNTLPNLIERIIGGFYAVTAPCGIASRFSLELAVNLEYTGERNHVSIGRCRAVDDGLVRVLVQDVDNRIQVESKQVIVACYAVILFPNRCQLSFQFSTQISPENSKWNLQSIVYVGKLVIEGRLNVLPWVEETADGILDWWKDCTDSVTGRHQVVN